jgi:hypothetical protein
MLRIISMQRSIKNNKIYKNIRITSKGKISRNIILIDPMPIMF